MVKSLNTSYRTVLLAFGMVAGIALAGSVRSDVESYSAPEYVPGELLFKLKADAETTANHSLVSDLLMNLEDTLGEGAIEQIKPIASDSQIYKVKVARADQDALVMDLLSGNAAIEYVQPNWITTLDAFESPNDESYDNLWGMKNVGQEIEGKLGKAGVDLDIEAVWDEGIRGNHNVVVAIVDTGIDWTHPDLAANLYTNPKEIADNGIDDDENGFVDDIHGWNFVGNKADTQDDQSHGTHVAGTIGAVGNNGIGVAGVNWKVRLLPIKIFNSSGSTTEEHIVNGMNYAVKMRPHVMNHSWGGTRTSPAREEVFKKALDAGIINVAAAGNVRADNDRVPHFPSSYGFDNMIAVSAISNDGTLASFSSFGAKKVHVAAPGNKVFSSTPEGNYGFKSGTSMATPHVTGLVALLLSQFPRLKPLEVRDLLIETSVSTDDLKGKLQAGGFVSARNAFKKLSAQTELAKH